MKIGKLHRNQHIEALEIIGGDWNVTMNAIDRRSGVSGRQKIVQIIEGIIQKENLVDVWRYKNPKKRQYTWTREQGRNASRIDFWLINQNTLQLVRETKIRPAILTDHQGVQVSIELCKELYKGPGLWKLNEMHLDEKEYREKINEIIKNSFTGDIVQGWAKFKEEVMKSSREYGKERSKKLKEEKQNLRDKMLELERMHEEEKHQDYIRIEHELEEFFEDKTQKATFQNKLNWMHLGERNSKYFYGLDCLC